MSLPTSKSKLKKYRATTALRIERSGEEMLPCTRCANSWKGGKEGRRCVALSGGDKCSSCTLQGKTCDVREKNRAPSLTDWESLDKQRRRLRDEEEEAMAKILRLRRQQRFLDDREQEMLRRGLSSLDELDRAEEKDKEEKERQEGERRRGEEAAKLAALPTSANSDPAFDLGLDPAFLAAFPPDSEMWATLGFGDRTPEVPPGTG